MKFLAFLKDSVREALDSKVIYVTLVLSVLVILLTFSVSFRPVPMQEQIADRFDFINWINSTVNEGKQKDKEKEKDKGPVKFEIANFEQTNKEAVNPWDGDYRFQFKVVAGSEEDAKQVRDDEQFRLLLKMLFESWFRMDNVNVKQIDSDKDTEVTYLVTSRGTKIKGRKEWVYEPSVLFGIVSLNFLRYFMPTTLGALINVICSYLVGTFGASITSLLSIIITAFFIPNLLRKGSVDLIISKPISRWTLLVYKYIGGLTFMFINTAFIVVGIWLAIGVRTQVWINSLFLYILILTFQFAILYAFSTLAAVVTRSAIVAILVSGVIWVLLVVAGYSYRWIDYYRPERVNKRIEMEEINRERIAERLKIDAKDKDKQKDRTTLAQDAFKASPTVCGVADAIHLLTPHYGDFDVLAGELIAEDLKDTDKDKDKKEKSLEAIDKSPINWPEALSISSFYIVVLLTLSCLWFHYREY